MEANETYFGMGYQGEAPFFSLSRDEHNIPQHAWMFYTGSLFDKFGARKAPVDSHIHIKYCDVVGKYTMPPPPTLFFFFFSLRDKTQMSSKALNLRQSPIDFRNEE